jgi:uncharacterized protein (DUF362 family)
MNPNLAESSSPAKPDSPEVFVATGSDAYRVTRRALELVSLAFVRGAKVLLKPNAGRMVQPMSGVDTHPEVVAAAIDAFKEAGAIVSVGDSPIAGVRALEALELCGITAVAHARNVRVVDLDLRAPVIVRVENGQAMQRFKVCAEVVENDVVVSIPVMKTHMHTVVTLSVKNMKGCLWRRSKVQLHMLEPIEGCAERPLDVAIADMATVLRPHFAIVDGIIGLEGLGPGAGNPKPLGAVVVSHDAFAADAVSCRLMGIDAAQVPHLKLGAHRTQSTIDVNRIRVTPENWASYASKFAPPPAELSISFPGVQVLDRNSCSACQSTLLMFLTRYGDNLFDYFGPERPVHIAIGKGHETVQPGTLCLGNCTISHRKTGPFVPGCPPVASEIHNVLAQRGNDEDD